MNYYYYYYSILNSILSSNVGKSLSQRSSKFIDFEILLFGDFDI